MSTRTDKGAVGVPRVLGVDPGRGPTYEAIVFISPPDYIPRPVKSFRMEPHVHQVDGEEQEVQVLCPCPRIAITLRDGDVVDVPHAVIQTFGDQNGHPTQITLTAVSVTPCEQPVFTPAAFFAVNHQKGAA